MSDRVVSTSFTDATQQVLVRPANARALDHVVLSNPDATACFLYVWLRSTDPTAGLPLTFASRHDKIPIAASQPTTTIPLGSCEAAFVVLAICTSGTDVTGDIAGPLHVSARWE
jgi:hypothetical protein